jgi:2-polyprenyl-3-methyl-5-hydroxy-6-metoxy-1,4-benzoquinol methylase
MRNEDSFQWHIGRPVMNDFDSKAAEAFAERLLGTLNAGALSLMLSIGHRTGLFDSMSGQAPASSEEIARRSDLNERYVREWLGAMVVGRVVTFDPDTRRYSLPPEYAAYLTRGASPNNMASFMQYIGLLGGVEDKIVDCFRKGGGVGYGEFGRFHEVMAEDSGQTVLPALMDSILPLCPGLVDSLREGIDVLDLGCGSGRAINLMARQFPRSRFRGIDLSQEAIDRAAREATTWGLSNARFEVRDATAFNDVEAYDFICTFDAIHDQADPARVLHNINRALRAHGTYLMQDISGTSHLERDVAHPAGPFLYAISTMHCMTVSLAQGGVGLGTMWGAETATKMLREAAFTKVRVEQLAHDFQNSYFVSRKD